MARIQPVLTSADFALVDQMADLTGSKRTDVIRSALTVYQWFVRQALSGSQVIARKPGGEEVTLEAAQLAMPEGKGTRLGPGELGLLAARLSDAPNEAEAILLREQLTRGFYGI